MFTVFYFGNRFSISYTFSILQFASEYLQVKNWNAKERYKQFVVNILLPMYQMHFSRV